MEEDGLMTLYNDDDVATGGREPVTSRSQCPPLNPLRHTYRHINYYNIGAFIIHCLLFCCSILRYVTSETTLGEGIDTTAMPDKALQEKEREILHKYKVR